jgi:hypothetical protein
MGFWGVKKSEGETMSSGTVCSTFSLVSGPCTEHIYRTHEPKILRIEFEVTGHLLRAEAFRSPLVEQLGRDCHGLK